jgi:hypothetical protein
MRGKHVKIELNTNARSELEKFTKTGKHSVKLVNRVKIIQARHNENTDGTRLKVFAHNRGTIRRKYPVILLEEFQVARACRRFSGRPLFPDAGQCPRQQSGPGQTL